MELAINDLVIVDTNGMYSQLDGVIGYIVTILPRAANIPGASPVKLNSVHIRVIASSPTSPWTNQDTIIVYEHEIRVLIKRYDLLMRGVPHGT